MTGVLADANIQGHVDRPYHLIDSDEWREMWGAVRLRRVTFADLGLPTSTVDRKLWTICQEQGLVLITANRNRDGPDSLGATIADSSRRHRFPS